MREQLVRLPGLVDVHVHLRQMGASQKEDFITGTKAAAAGGYTMVIDMPNDPVPTITPSRLRDKINTAEEKGIFVDVGFHMGVSNSAPLWFDFGIESFFSPKVYFDETTGDLWIVNLEKQEEIFRSWPKESLRPIIVHAEGAKGSLSRAVKLAKKYDQRLHIAHLSTRKELETVRQAKKDGLEITSEVSAHHLKLNHFNELVLGPFAMMRPPLGTEADVEYLWDHLDEIDIFASDHAPHTREEKMQNYPATIINGVPGLETTLPVLYTVMRKRGETSESALETIKKMGSQRPREIFRIPEQANTYFLFDTTPSYTLTSHFLKTKCGWSPFEGMELQGKVVKTVLRKQTVFERGKIIDGPKGKVIYPEK